MEIDPVDGDSLELVAAESPRDSADAVENRMDVLEPASLEEAGNAADTGKPGLVAQLSGVDSADIEGEQEEVGLLLMYLWRKQPPFQREHFCVDSKEHLTLKAHLRAPCFMCHRNALNFLPGHILERTKFGP